MERCGIMRNEIVIYILGVFLFFFILDSILGLTKNTKKNTMYYIYLIIYILFLYLCLFNRSMKENKIYSDGTYIKEWIKIIFKNKTVFKNVIGNIIIFIPMGIFLKTIHIKWVYQIILSILIIICIETLQYIIQIGVFDIMDILLNFLGTLIGYIIVKKKRWKNE